LFTVGKEYFLSYEKFPFFRDQTLKDIQDVRLLHGRHLYWQRLDVDLEIDNLENPNKYPLRSKSIKESATTRSKKRVVLGKAT
jgi:hypothetical protein